MNKDLTKNLAPGHSSCAGCALPVIIRAILSESKDPVVVINATSCSEVTTTLYPYTAWKVPYIHNAFENAGATVSGVEKAYEALRKKGKIKGKINFVVFAGDGGTYDIGFQALSGALERGHNFLYVVYDNGAYMNTGNQRSSATPFGANTETAPAGKNSFGKTQKRKDLMAIVAAHHVPYAAQANVAYLADLKKKAQKAFAAQGPKFLNVFSPCTNNWKFPPAQYVAVAKLATETNFWPLYEIESGKYKINYIPKERKILEEFLKTQGRFKHLFSEKNKSVISEMQKQVDEEWEKIKELAC
jgi:pyruvate ferredoxin oxidoreductase beta subunit